MWVLLPKTVTVAIMVIVWEITEDVIWFVISLPVRLSIN
jgi:hypothetical protein